MAYAQNFFTQNQKENNSTKCQIHLLYNFLYPDSTHKH